MTRVAMSCFVFFLFFSLVVTCSSMAQNSTVQPISWHDADVVWIESDGIRHEVFFATLHEGKWSSPIQVTDDYFDNLHPVIDRDKQGKRWLFWTASDDGKLSLHYTTYSDSEWSEIRDVPLDLHSSIAPSVAADQKNVIWLVWAGNTGNVDDIYWATMQNGIWSVAETLHEKDDVPDILPKISLTETGALQVVWKKFLDGQYQDVQSIRDRNKWNSPEVIENDAEAKIYLLQKEQEIPLPEFIKDDDKAFVRIY